ncbi:hypothetical protein SCUCBS95973_004751 [Sporothrix curviconia]|uniref:MARVEL domain-containing protein n=1 Tax=Sporothrix curviconia TaxID=1260050 RepID=A0ABP0BR83_9PEZI
MPSRARVTRGCESALIAIRVVSLALELATLGVLTYLSVVFWYDHATNPIAYIGTTVALLTDAAELWTLATINRPNWLQARLAWIALGDVTSAVLLFFSWIWLITRGMFWSCLVDSDDNGTSSNSNSNRNSNGNSATYSNCDMPYPDDDLQRLSWVLPFVLAAFHLIVVMVYCSGLQRHVQPGTT